MDPVKNSSTQSVRQYGIQRFHFIHTMPFYDNPWSNLNSSIVVKLLVSINTIFTNNSSKQQTLLNDNESVLKHIFCIHA